MSVAIIRNVRAANTPNCTLRFLAPLVLTLTLLTSSSCISQEIQLDKIKLPPRFEISVYANNVQGARSMTLSPKGILFVGSRERWRGLRCSRSQEAEQGRPGDHHRSRTELAQRRGAVERIAVRCRSQSCAAVR